MLQTISFILNDEQITARVVPSITLLDYIRYSKGFTGTKIGCREGDCGACTVIVGSIKNSKLEYHTIVSCLTPLINIQGKHVVTIEGLNLIDSLNIFQLEIVNKGGTQCGFCTPGFIVSFMGYILHTEFLDYDEGIHAIDGNICRCTGYKSIERAVKSTVEQLIEYHPLSVKKLVKLNILPEYFLKIPKLLKNILTEPIKENGDSLDLLVGGGTDLYVQNPYTMSQRNASYLEQRSDLEFISQDNSHLSVGSSTSLTNLLKNDTFVEIIGNPEKIRSLFASTLIRNIATLGGNIVNASPIGDFTIILLALNASLELDWKKNLRTIRLNHFYQGYRELDLKELEIVKSIKIPITIDHHFNFEKVSKRTNLDIASVNSAMKIKVNDKKIESVAISAGGVAPIPKFLHQTVEFLMDNTLNVETVKEAAKIALSEVSPISDIRGTKDYKSLLLRQLIYTHFVTLFPSLIPLEEMIS